MKTTQPAFVSKEYTIDWEFQYQQLYADVERMILRLGGNYDDARDVFQETLLVLYEKQRSGRFKNLGKLSGFVITVAKTTWFKMLRKRRRNMNLECRYTQKRVMEDAEEYVDAGSKIHKMHRCMSMMTPGNLRVLELYYVSGMNFREIAEDLGFSNAQSVKNKKYRASKRLKNIWELVSEKK